MKLLTLDKDAWFWLDSSAWFKANSCINGSTIVNEFNSEVRSNGSREVFIEPLSAYLITDYYSVNGRHKKSSLGELFILTTF